MTERSLIATRQWRRLERLHQVFPGLVMVQRRDGCFSEVSVATADGVRRMTAENLGDAVDALFEQLIDQGLIPRG